jgi:hypothetical protein
MRTDQEQPLNDFVQRHLLQSMISYVVAKMAGDTATADRLTTNRPLSQ